MKPINCAATRRRLNAYHDRELGISEQIAVSAHLEWCDECAQALDDMRAVSRILQTAGHGRVMMTNEEGAAFNAAVVNRVKAERQVSLTTQIQALFEDMHLVYAGVGAAAAALVSIVIMLTMMRFATSERPDSLAAIVNVLATPLECEPGVDPSASACHERWTGRFQRANESAEQDAIFALESVITRHGRVASLELLRGGRHPAPAMAADAYLVERLLDVVSRARLEQTPAAPLSDLGRMVWWVERATVRANTKPAEDLPLPSKKRADTTASSWHIVRA
jgi:putative zinc finger protein